MLQIRTIKLALRRTTIEVAFHEDSSHSTAALAFLAGAAAAYRYVLEEGKEPKALLDQFKSYPNQEVLLLALGMPRGEE